MNLPAWRSSSMAVLLSLPMLIPAVPASGLRLAAQQEASSSSAPEPQVAEPSPPPGEPISAGQMAAEPRSALQWEARGDALRGEKLYPEAEAAFNEALKRSPGKNAVLHNKIGITQLQMSRYTEARKSFELAIKANKAFAEAHNNLGVIHYIQKKYRRSEKQYRRALALNNASASVHNNLATAYFAEKKFDEAMVEYQRAMELDPEIFERHSRFGVAAQMSSPEDRATFDYVLAKMYAKNGNTERALQQLKKALEDGYKEIGKVYQDEEFTQLRKDPRFGELMSSQPVAIPE